jgi:hypothetical protein
MPVLMDSSLVPSHFLVVDATGDRVVYAFCRPRDFSSGNSTDNDLVYYESRDGGASWAAGSTGPLYNVTSYARGDPERAYGDAAGAFTSDGRLHLIWVSAFYNDSAGVTSDSRCFVRHWMESAGGTDAPLGLEHSNIVLAADWVPEGRPGVFNRNISNLSLGVGDGTLLCPVGGAGTNLDYLYLVYTQYGSPDSADMADRSADSLQNGNIYMTVSPDGGAYWSRGLCLTTVDSIGGTPTRSPGCDPDVVESCFCERLGTIASRVGTIANVTYDGDQDAGSSFYGDGRFTWGYVMYLRISSDTTALLCPQRACWTARSCGPPGDLNADSVADVFDVITAIDVIFAGASPVASPPGCPWDVTDINCDNVPDVFDIVRLIDYVFQGGVSLPNPCTCRA